MIRFPMERSCQGNGRSADESHLLVAESVSQKMMKLIMAKVRLKEHNTRADSLVDFCPSMA